LEKEEREYQAERAKKAPQAPMGATSGTRNRLLRTSANGGSNSTLLQAQAASHDRRDQAAANAPYKAPIAQASGATRFLNSRVEEDKARAAKESSSSGGRNIFRSTTSQAIPTVNTYDSQPRLARSSSYQNEPSPQSYSNNNNYDNRSSNYNGYGEGNNYSSGNGNNSNAGNGRSSSNSSNPPEKEKKEKKKGFLSRFT
jgi:hypothetical protein